MIRHANKQLGVTIEKEDIPYIKQCAEYMLKNDIENILLILEQEPNKEVVVFNLDFLTHIAPQNIKQLKIYGDCSGYENLEHFYNIEYLSITPKNNEKIDVSKFKKLTALTTDNLPAIQNIPNNQLKYFSSGDKNLDWETLAELSSLERVYFYEVKNFSFDKIKSLSNLKRVDVRLSSIKNLAGIENLKKLEELTLYYNRGLDNLDGLETLPVLRSVDISNSPKIKDITPLSNCKLLEELDLESLKNTDLTILANARNIGLLRLTSCGNIPSLKFIDNLPKLEFFAFVDTNIVDGDLTPCKRLKYAGTLDKRHYNIKSSDLPKQRTKYHPLIVESYDAEYIFFDKKTQKA